MHHGQPAEEPAEPVTGVEAPVEIQVTPENKSEVQARARAVEKIIIGGMPESEKKYAKLWKKIDTYIDQVRVGKQAPELRDELSSQETSESLSQMMSKLRTGGPGNDLGDILAGQEVGQLRERELRALTALAGVMNRVTRSTWKRGVLESSKLRRWEELDSQERQLVRAAEYVEQGVKAIKLKHGVLSADEHKNLADFIRPVQTLARSHDIPSPMREILAAAVLHGQTEEMVTKSQPPTAAASEAPKKPERVVEPWKLKIFDQEVEMPSAEHQKLSRELKALMTESEKNPQKMLQARFRAARMLAHLRRAGVRLMNPKGKEWVDAELNARRGEMSSLGGEPLSHYLMFLKYTGALKGSLHESEAALIREGLVWRSNLVNPGNLLQMYSNAKYLGMQLDARLFIPAFERELKLVVDSGDARRMTYALGRLNYLKVTSPGLEKLRNLAMPQIQTYLAKTPGEGAEREQFVNTYLVATSVAKVPELPPALRGGLVEQVAAARTEAQAAGKSAVWQRLTVYLGSLVSLTQRMEKGISEPLQPVENIELAEEPRWYDRWWKNFETWWSGKFGGGQKPDTRKPPVKVQLPGEPQPAQGPPGQVQEFMQDLTKPAPSGEVLVPEVAEQPKAESLIEESEKGSTQQPPATGEKQKISLEKLAEELGIRPTYFEAMKENIKYAIGKGRLSMPAGFEKTPEGKIVPDKETQKKLEDYEKIAEAMGYDLDLSELEIDTKIPNVTAPITPLLLPNP